MVFSSLLFLFLFLPVTFLLYCLAPKKLKNLVLLIFSLIFYAWGEPLHIFIMLITTVYIYFFGRFMERCELNGKIKTKKFLLILTLLLSLGTLAFYKYTGFVVSNLPFLKHTSLSVFSPALPVGISFYTFQSLSYVIDVYRGSVKAQKNWICFAMYISLFPQLIAGPIVRYGDIEMQLENHPMSWEKLSAGIQRFLIGLAKKILLANQIGALWEEISQSGELTLLSAWLGVNAFAFQIYFDFSAYSDMAIGLGSMFGFTFPENFRYPYMSKSITEFWRRWHITLSTWFREYVYIPLGGNRKGVFRQILNLGVVWALTGLWHGADWRFLIWGLYFFVILVLEKFVFRHLTRLPSVLQHLYALLLILLGWVVFACESTEQTFHFYKAMLGIGTAVSSPASLFLLTENLLLLLILAVGCTNLPFRFAGFLKKKLPEKGFAVLSLAFSLGVLVISISFLVADSYNPFLYFRF